ncbi:MAG: PepSY domain-containing protein [Proteobacteria bacterium]|nr:PepSY domain-containing protein [Pseudomonadota bacterium]
MKNSLRQSMAWLHTWSGLITGWLLFVIFVAGTLSCFDRELDDWMRPSLHEIDGTPGPKFDAAMAAMRERAPEAHVWWAHVPAERERAMEAYFMLDDGTQGKQTLDPRTGAAVPETAGGEFFFDLHWNLHAGTFGMYVVGLAGMLMLVALVAGVITHRRIFKDIFTFRPHAGGQRAWLDGHNITGVLGLPFHLMIAYTGVIIFATSYVFGGLNTAYGGDLERYFQEAGGSYERPEVGQPLARLHSIDTLVTDAERRMGVPVDWASVEHPDDASAVIAFGTDHSRRVAWDMQQVIYDAATGEFLHHTRPPATGYLTYSFLGGLHMVQFGGAALRWLYFLLGLTGCVMLASGMQVWVRKRAQRVAAAGALSGYGLVLGLNVGVVAGMPFACAVLLLANRLLPADLNARAEAEIAVFCGAWIIAALWGAWRTRSARGWRDLFAATAAALAAIPLVNLATTDASHLLVTVPGGEWALASVDLTVLLLAAGFGWLARQAAPRGASVPVAAVRPVAQEA